MEKYLSISSEKNDCDFSFNTVEDIDGKNNFGIFVGPSNNNLGINAQNSIYIKSIKSKRLEFAGNIPVDAEKIANGEYKQITQEGGARYLIIYSIDGTTVVSKSPKILLIDGRYCIDKNILINIFDDHASHCINKLDATLKKPICLELLGSTIKPTLPSHCPELLK